MSTPVEALALRREQIAATHLRPAAASDPASCARGLHHTALVCADVETTVRFYQDVLLFPLTHVTENRDYPGRRTSSSTSERQRAGLLRPDRSHFTS